jgi:hypothetical protein
MSRAGVGTHVAVAVKRHLSWVESMGGGSLEVVAGERCGTQYVHHGSEECLRERWLVEHGKFCNQILICAGK